MRSRQDCPSYHEVEVDVFADDELELGEGDQSEADTACPAGIPGFRPGKRCWGC